MFVSKTKYQEMEKRALRAEHSVRVITLEHNALVGKWNVLVRQINARGGESFLQGAQKKPSQFSPEDVQRLIQLCHPDKHGGKTMATEMTQKLLRLKEEFA